MYDVHLAFHARMRPRALALLTPRRRATYAEFDADVNRYAAALRALGVGPDSGVVRLDTGLAYRRAVLLMALVRLGVTCGAPTDARADLQLSEQPGASGDRVLRLSTAWFAEVDRATPTPVPSAPRDPDGAARVLLSSGTTQAPRRVPLSWRRMDTSTLNVLSAYAGGHHGPWALCTGLDSGLGNSLAAAAWTTGGAVALGFHGADLATLMERNANGLAGMTPIQLRELIASLPEGYDLRPDWRVMVTGAAMAPAEARRARARLTPDIQIIYGSTEAGRATVGPAARLEQQPGFSGWPVPGAIIEILGPDGAPLPPGETGELRIRTDRTTAGYLDDPEETARVFHDGYFHPGDLGHWLPDGALVVEGRLDERINIGGVKYSPGAVEAALMEHGNVRDAAMFTLPDADGAPECWIAVVAEGEVTREALLAFLGQQKLRFPMLRIAWTDAIPRSALGKIDRSALQAQTAAAVAAARS